MRDLDGAVRLAGAVVEAVGGKVPVTVKMRLGWSEDAIVAPTLARRLEEEAGVSAVTVHGRTGEQKFSGKVRLPGIAQVVAAVRRIPVIGNGDVDGPEAAERMIRETGCAGVMIGRAALSDQWIFRETHARLAGLPPPPPATADERVAVMTAHFRHLLARRGEHAAVTQFRQRISWYSARLAPCPELKRRMREMTSAAEFDDIVGWFLERRRADPKAMC